MWFRSNQGTYGGNGSDDFWVEMFENNEELWNTYKDVVYDNMFDSGTRDVEPAIVYRYDTSVGFDGRYEQIKNVFRPMTDNTMSIAASNIRYGSPEYCWE